MTARNPLLDALILGAHARAAAEVRGEAPQSEAKTAIKSTGAGSSSTCSLCPLGATCGGHSLVTSLAPNHVANLVRAARDAATLLGRAAEIAFAQASLPGPRSAAATQAMHDFEAGARRVLVALAAEEARQRHAGTCTGCGGRLILETECADCRQARERPGR